MTTQPTNNAVPSESPKDLKFNAGKIDEFVTSKGWTYIDRFGVKHYTMEGIIYLSQQVMSAFGYVTLTGVNFTTGATVSNPNETLFNQADNSYYKWTGSFADGGKIVPANSTPESTGGIGPGKWLNVGDASLRSQLANVNDNSLGDALIGVRQPLSGVARTQHDKNSEHLTFEDFGAVGNSATLASKYSSLTEAQALYPFINSLTQTIDYAAFQAAFNYAVNKNVTFNLLDKTYVFSNQLSIDGNNTHLAIKGSGSTNCSLNFVSTSGGISAGKNTAIGTFRAEGFQVYAGAVIPNSAIYIKTTSGSPKAVRLHDITAFGDSVAGPNTAGQWKDGLAYLVDVPYPELSYCYFFGIGGSAATVDASIISSGFTFVAQNSASLFIQMQNCFANGCNRGSWFVSSIAPGIEGVVMKDCNFVGVNLGVVAQSSISTYRPPQYFIHNSQIEFIQRGAAFDTVSCVDISDSLFLAAPDTDSALTGILLNNVEYFNIHDCDIYARPIHTKMDGISVSGASDWGRAHSNNITAGSSGTGVVYGGDSTKCYHYNNKLIGGARTYSNQSTKAGTNTPESYNKNGEMSKDNGENWIEKTGSVLVTTNASGAFTVNYQVPFPNATYTVTACNGDSAVSTASVVLTNSLSSPSGFGGVFVGSGAGSRRLNFFAKGY